jgi:ElaB/YqjD/DUF883 family membrane-anchored ribosome-binding protein
MMTFKGEGTPSATKDIARDLQLLQDDVSKLAEEITGRLGEGGNAALNQARERIEHLRHSISQMVANGDAGGLAAGVAASLEEALHDHPLTTLTTAFTVGFALGTGWHRRH